jgi:hypothetical protein
MKRMMSIDVLKKFLHSAYTGTLVCYFNNENSGL